MFSVLTLQHQTNTVYTLINIFSKQEAFIYIIQISDPAECTAFPSLKGYFSLKDAPQFQVEKF